MPDEIRFTIHICFIIQFPGQCIQYTVYRVIVIQFDVSAVRDQCHLRSLRRFANNQIAICVIRRRFAVSGMGIVHIRITADVVDCDRVLVILENISGCVFTRAADEFVQMAAGPLFSTPSTGFHRAPLFVVPRRTVLQPDVDGTVEGLAPGCLSGIAEFIVGNARPGRIFCSKSQIHIGIRFRFTGINGTGRCGHVSFQYQIIISGGGSNIIFIQIDIEAGRRTFCQQRVIFVRIVLIDFDVAAAVDGQFGMTPVRKKSVPVDFGIHIAVDGDFRPHLQIVIVAAVNQGAAVITPGAVLGVQPPIIAVASHSGDIPVECDFGITGGVKPQRVADALDIQIDIAIDGEFIRIVRILLSLTAHIECFDAAFVTVTGSIDNQFIRRNRRAFEAIRRNPIMLSVISRRSGLDGQRFSGGIDIDSMSHVAGYIDGCSFCCRRAVYDIINGGIFREDIVLTFVREHAPLYVRGIIGFDPGDGRRKFCDGLPRIVAFDIVSFSRIGKGEIADFKRRGAGCEPVCNFDSPGKIPFPAGIRRVSQFSGERLQDASDIVLIRHRHAGIIGDEGNEGIRCRAPDCDITGCIIRSGFPVSCMGIVHICIAAVIGNLNRGRRGGEEIPGAALIRAAMQRRQMGHTVIHPVMILAAGGRQVLCLNRIGFGQGTMNP